MLGLKSTITNSPNPLIPLPKFNFPSKPLKTHLKFPKSKSKYHLFASNNEIQEPKNQENRNNNNNGSSQNGEELNGNRKNPLFNIKLGELLLDPDPDNILAVGLTGLLAWASAQVLWQLFIVSFAILVAALKYSFIAALLVFILITLL